MNERQQQISRSLKFMAIAVGLTLISVVLAFICAMMLTGKIQVGTTLKEICANTPFKVLFSISFFIPTASAICVIIGLFKSRFAGQLFRVAFDDAILALIFSLISACFVFVPFFFTFITIMLDVMSIFLSVSVFFIYMLAIRTVHIENGDQKLERKTVTTEFVYVFTELLYCIFISIVLSNCISNKTVAFVFAIISLVCGIIGYSFCLGFIIQSDKSISTLTPISRNDDSGDVFD